jgi:predicted nucleic acid-binding protein
MVDTSFLVDLARGDAGARAAAVAAEGGSEAVRVPAPAVAKFWEGVERSRRPVRDRAALEAFLLGVPTVAFEARHAIVAARLLAAAAREGAPLDPFDAMVAAMALQEDEALLTRDVRDVGGIVGLRARAY